LRKSLYLVQGLASVPKQSGAEAHALQTLARIAEAPPCNGVACFSGESWSILEPDDTVKEIYAGSNRL
jgi:hypothetical protein